MTIKTEVAEFFKKFNNDYDISDILQKLKNLQIENELINSISLLELFELSIKYGQIEIVQYIYEEYGLEYPFKIVEKFINFIPGQDTRAGIAVSGSIGFREGLKFDIQDKFSYNRNKCIAYLVNSRKLSKSRYIPNVGICYKFKK